MLEILLYPIIKVSERLSRRHVCVQLLLRAGRNIIKCISSASFLAPAAEILSPNEALRIA